jgi:hypothetical protein
MERHPIPMHILDLALVAKLDPQDAALTEPPEEST